MSIKFSNSNLKFTSKFHSKTKGFTLVELIISMVIIAVAFVGTLLVINMVTSQSGRPVVMSHSIAVAKSYLTEILLKDFPSTIPCPSPPGLRSEYYNICDYHNLYDLGAKDQNGNVIAYLANYEIRVNIDTTTASLDGLTSGTEVVRIDVRTKIQGDDSEVLISGYKTNY